MAAHSAKLASPKAPTVFFALDGRFTPTTGNSILNASGKDSIAARVSEMFLNALRRCVILPIYQN